MAKPKILVAPLDWGLGHSTRCIPIVNELVTLNCEIWIAGKGKNLSILQMEFPLLNFLELEGYDIYYHSAKNNLTWTIARQIPKIRERIQYENEWLEEMMEIHHFDAVISDNRYGLYTDKALSIFITHQLYIKTGLGDWADKVLQRINYRYINSFDECWIPDFETPFNLAGSLSGSMQPPANTKYIGPLSRFEKKDELIKYSLLIILSGPEPRRTIWEEKLLQQLQNYRGRVLLVRGLPDAEEQPRINASIEILNYLPSSKLNTAIEQAEWVICRSGYTSVMDLVQLKHKAIIVPTPGQPEQEYLAKYLHQKEVFYTVSEKSFSLQKCLDEAVDFPFNFTVFDQRPASYKTNIRTLIEQIANRYCVKEAL